MKRTILLFISAFAFVFSMAALAVPPYYPNVYSEGNRWMIVAYDDSAANHRTMAKQELCFVPTYVSGQHVRGVWYSTTFHDWNGLWSQEGDQVVMTGDYADDVGHDGIQWELVTQSPRDEGYGHWQEWREDGRFGRLVAFTNAKLMRTGRCRIVIKDDHLKSGNLPRGQLEKLLPEVESASLEAPTPPKGVAGPMTVNMDDLPNSSEPVETK